MRLKNTFLILLKLAVIVGLIVYLPTKVSGSNAQVINAINNEQNNPTTPVATNPTNTSFVPTKDKKIHIYNTHQGEEYDGFNVVEGANYLKDCLNNKDTSAMLKEMILKAIKRFINSL